MTGDRLSKVFHGVYFILFFVVFIYIVARQNPPGVLLLLSFAGLSIFIVLFWRLQKKEITDVKLCRITWLVLSVMGILMGILGWMMIPKLQTDLGMVYYGAMEIIQKGKMSDYQTIYNQITTITNMTNNEYFVVYPNNLPILFLITTFYRFVCAFGISMESDLGIYMGILLNLAVILFSVSLGMRVARKLWGNKAAFCYLFLAAFFLPFYTNVHRFYTDTLTMPFPLLSIFIYLKLKEMKDLKKKLPLRVGLGICLVVGFLLKGSCFIVAVAILIHALLTSFSKKTWKSVIVVTICFVFVYQSWNFYIHHCNWVDMSREEEQTFPAAHWIMMALSGTGGFDPADFAYTYSYGTKEEKQTADIERAKEKIEGHGSIAGFLDFELQKISATWGDGKFAQQVHLTWMKKDTVVNEFIRTDGKYHMLFYFYTTVFILLMYLLFLVSIAKGMIRKNTEMTLIHIMIFGVLLFFSFWETKSRYLLNFIPVFLFCMVDGVENICNYIIKRKRKAIK